MSTSSPKSQQKLSEEELAELGEAFDLFDRDQNGYITVEELGNVLALLGQEAQHDDLQALLASADRDNNGVIDRQEFISLMATHLFTEETRPTAEQELMAAFKVFDVDGDGMIGREELKAALLGMGERVADEEVEMMIRAADKNGDGRIDFEEFSDLLNNQAQ
jgi:calmodulin